MRQQITGDQVWEEIDNNVFCVLGLVTPDAQARTAGMMYVIDGRKLYMAAQRSAWKTKHIERNPHVSITVAIPRRVPFLPWIRIPASTISFAGTARVLTRDEVSLGLFKRLYRHDSATDWCAIEVTPENHFVTYGVDMSLIQMRSPAKARARVPVGVA